MSGAAKEHISFDVETSRILEILSEEIYDSPKAFLRENVQNAYDAILMRCTAEESNLSDGVIDITVDGTRLSVRDNGIGMTEEVLRENYWKAGSSGKKSELAQRSGVIGTFGIGAMANFGVCNVLHVETRSVDSSVTFVSTARREDLKINQDCIELQRIEDDRKPGTTVIAELDTEQAIDAGSAGEYLRQYVRFLPIPVRVNGETISQESFDSALDSKASEFEEVSSCKVSKHGFKGSLQVLVNAQSRVAARLTDISLNGVKLDGESLFVQQGGHTHGFRNLFGLAPIPVSGHYNFGGYVNLNVLHPTAGREALSRESIQHVANIVEMIEIEVSRVISEMPSADTNQQFQKYILAHGLTSYAKNMTIDVFPANVNIPLGDIHTYEPDKVKHFYKGRDATVINRFASDRANLFHLSQANPRRKLQLNYLKTIVKVDEVPEQTIVDRIEPEQLTFEEAMFLVRLRGVLLDDYLMPDVDAGFATMSHGLAFHADKSDDILYISIARSIQPVNIVIECYHTARDVFEGFMKDFVREHLYPHIRDYVPSSTKQGRDALYRRLKENKELFRLKEGDYGEIENLLADYLAGRTEFSEVLRTSSGRGSGQRQELKKEQVGSVEEEFPDIIEGDAPENPQNKFDATPPLMRDDLKSEKKVLTVSEEHIKLNNFRMFLALSDRVVKREGEFLRWPHTTKVIWGAHRVIYIFSDESGELSLYYDIELKMPLETDQTGGEMFPTTTIVTQNRIFVPVPGELEPAFQIPEGEREYYVRFDTIP